MGDSYSSGTGTRDYFDAGCERSNFAYGPLINPAIPGDFAMTACGGAQTSNVINSQGNQLGSDVDYVSISIGGNDAGFSSTLLACGQPITDCQDEIDGSRNTITTALPGRLDNVANKIKTNAPNARIMFVSYPRIFPANGNDCSAATFFSSGEISQLNQMADLLADTTRAAALRNDVGFVDARGAYLGHAWCEDEWINGLSNPTGESYHPNKNGHALGYQGVVREALLAAPARNFTRGPNARLTFSRGGNIWVANANGTFQTDLMPLSTGSSDIDPEFSPDGTKIAFASNRDGSQDIWKMNIDGTGLQKLTATGDVDTQPSWSPNGVSIVFQRGGEIYRMKADGSGQTRLTNNGTAESSPAWSPDGAEIAYQRGSEIYRMEGDGQGQWRLTSGATDSQPSWSPDGAKIVFTSSRNSGGIHTMTSTGGTITKLSSTSSGDSAPVYSPDGGQIAFVRSNQVFTMSASGGTGTSRTAGSDATPSWQGDQTPPETTITSGKPATVTTATPPVDFDGTEDGTTFQCKVDGGAFAACAAPFSPSSALTESAHSIQVRARDAAGNFDPSPDSWSFIVDLPESTAITSGPTGPLKATSASFGFSTDVSGATFQCALDGEAFAACTSPKAYPTLAQGPHTFAVRSVDPLGNPDPNPATRSFVVDTVSPTVSVPSGPPALSDDATPTFELTANEPDVNFECRLTRVSFDTDWQACDPSETYDELPDGTNYILQVRGTDAAGNQSSAVAYGVQFAIDTTAPVATITDGPSPGTPITVNSATFEFGAGEPSVGFQCRLDSADDGGWSSCSSPRTLSGLTHGSHHFEVRALDQAGNVQEIPAARDFTVNVDDPVVTYSSFPSNPSDEKRPTIEWTSSDGNATFECSLDSAPYAACPAPSSFAVESDLAEGAHTFDLRATDEFGDTIDVPQRTWTVDTTRPDTTILTGPAEFTSLTTASFTGESEDPLATLECSLDGSSTWTTLCSFSNLLDGEHSVRMRARDSGGNVDLSPDSWTWTVDTTPPTMTSPIADGPSGTTSETSATFTLVSNESGATFQCDLDGGGFGACSLPLTGLADGPHTFRARAVDRAGNVGNPTAQKTWTVDTTPPGTTIGATYNDTDANFSYGTTPSEPSAAFECRLDGGDWETCTTPIPHLVTGLADGQHSFEVRARDAIGNVDATPASRTWWVSPPASIDSGPSGSVSSTSATFGVSSTVIGAGVQCSFDGGAFGACTKPVLAEGTHTVKARATDPTSNNVTQVPDQPSRTWTVDITAPDTTLSGGPTGSVPSTGATFTVSSPDATATVECSLDGAAFGACAPLTGLADGEHTFRARAKDAAGNVDTTPASRTWTVDTQAPDTTLTGGPTGTVSSASATFTAGSPDGTAAVECSLDGAAFGACAPLTGLAQGPHTFRARAKDAAGNVDATPASRTWTVDTIAPKITIGGDNSGYTLSSDEAVSGFVCSLDGSADAPCVSGVSFGDMAPGEHTLRVRATDAAGNTGEATRTWTVASPPPPEQPPVVQPPKTPEQPKPPLPAIPATAMLAKGTLRLPSSGKVTAATVRCGNTRCTVTTASRITVKVGRTKYTLAVAAPRTLQPVSAPAAITLSVPSKLRRALKGKTLSVPLKIVVAQPPGQTITAKGTVKLRG